MLFFPVFDHFRKRHYCPRTHPRGHFEFPTGGYLNVSGNLNVSVQNIEKAGAKRKISILLEILNFSHCFEITAK
jgi:hypothetical protein